MCGGGGVEEGWGVGGGGIGEVLNRAFAVVSKKQAVPHALEILQSVAVIGLGKLGGNEVGYGSDWDILFVYDDHGTVQHSSQILEALVEEILSYGQNLRVCDLPVELDARLRPEGRFGALARTPTDYARYYKEEAQLWELQVLTKARWIAGSEETSTNYLNAVNVAIYGHLLTR